MAKASPILNNFNAGELTPFLEGRPDIAVYSNGLRLCENWIPLVQGPITARPGTKFVHPVKDSSKSTRVVRFEFSTTQAYILEFGDQYIRFHRNHGVITQTAQNITGITKANPAVVTYSGSDTYANGDKVLITGVLGMVEVNNREFTVANVNVGANTFELSGVNSSAYTTYSSAGTIAEIYEISSPYLEADLFQLKFTQSQDVLYISHPTYAPRKLSRSAHTSWALSTISFQDGPYLSTNVSTTKLALSGNSGSVTVIASAITGINSDAGFASTDVGRLIRFKDHANQWTWLTITAFTDTTHVTATVSGDAATAVTGTISGATRANPCVVTATGHGFSNGDYVYISGVSGMTELNGNFYTVANKAANTFELEGIDSSAYTAYSSGGTAVHAELDWRLGVWSGTTGYPGAVNFYGDRLFWAGSTGSPQRLDGSVVGDYENFQPSADDGTVADDDAIAITLNSNNVDVIRALSDDEKGLIVLTTGGEWIVRPFQAGEALSPTNVQATRSTNYGSKNVAPIRVGKATLFVQRAGLKLRELAYVYEDDGFRAPDMTMRSEHITAGGIVELAYTAEPQSIVWAVRGDGQLLGFTYEREQEVLGWHRHVLGGAFSTGDAVVESIASIPNPAGDADELWMIVKRTVGGATVRYIEYLTPFWESTNDQEDAFFVDCGLTYDSSATTTISGLYHLRSQTVTILADGASHPTATVSATGILTLSRSSSVVQIGLGYESDAYTQRIEAGAADGTAQGKTKRIRKAVFRFWQSLGLQIGPDEDNLDSIIFRSVGDDLGVAPPLYDGDIERFWPGGYDTDGGVYIKRYQPFPATILAIMPRVTTQDG